MTINTATTKLFEYLLNSGATYINLSGSKLDDFHKIILISENEELDRAALTLGLRELEKSGIVQSHQTKTALYFILVKPLDDFSQTVTITPKVSVSLAAVINEICKEMEIEGHNCNAMSITNKDLEVLLAILTEYFKKARNI